VVKPVIGNTGVRKVNTVDECYLVGYTDDRHAEFIRRGGRLTHEVTRGVTPVVKPVIGNTGVRKVNTVDECYLVGYTDDRLFCSVP